MHYDGSPGRTKKRKPRRTLLAVYGTLSILEAAFIAYSLKKPKKK